MTNLARRCAQAGASLRDVQRIAGHADLGTTERYVEPSLEAQPAWRLHDLRRTVASGMARLRIEPWVVEKVLNHATGQLSGVAGVYNRWGYSDEKRDALGAWARHLENLIRPSATNVIELRKETGQ